MKKELGNRGEEIAAAYLKKQGYKILNRNFRTKFGEVDIICCQARTIVFVEVKTRTDDKFGTPEESVTRIKQDHIRRTALAYLQTELKRYHEIRFDVIGIKINGSEFEVNHLQAAF
jgi:putative endonuclease